MPHQRFQRFDLQSFHTSTSDEAYMQNLVAHKAIIRQEDVLKFLLYKPLQNL